MIIIFIIHILFLVFYAGFVWALIWHYREYALPHDKANWIIGTFITIASLLAIIATALFFIIPWDNIF